MTQRNWGIHRRAPGLHLVGDTDDSWPDTTSPWPDMDSPEGRSAQLGGYVAMLLGGMVLGGLITFWVMQ